MDKGGDLSAKDKHGWSVLQYAVRYATLDTVEFLRDTLNPDLNVDETATLLWAGAHGFVEICPVREHVAENTDTAVSTVEQLLVAWTDMVIDGIRKR